ncbi:MAG: TlpA family protein disulfide reductase [Flavobacterium sp.]|nr:MAG: TlpA family protein disulfide reductase [Flavobacterium sp.]
MFRKRSHLLLFLLPVYLLQSCDEPAIGEPVYSAEMILKDEETTLNYLRGTVTLSDDFSGYDELEKQISKKDFLTGLTTGEYLPMLLKSKTGGKVYKLHKIHGPISDYCKDYIVFESKKTLKYYLMEGKKVANYNFVDLNGKIYNEITMRGKIVVLKFWFLGCINCIQEMPEMNKIVRKYQGNDEVVFLSLAFDKPEALNNFLKKTTFLYATVPDQKHYITEVLDIQLFSSHMLIDKKGKIVKVVSEYPEIEKSLDALADKDLRDNMN